MTLAALSLIPICSILNHLGGQSTVIPNPRIVCRVIGIPIAFGLVSLLVGLPLVTMAYATVSVLAGTALWAIPGWASGFSCVGGCEDGRQQTWLSSIVNYMMGVNYTDKLTTNQCWEWGVIYFTLRGMYMYPMFIGLGYFVVDWAYMIGFGAALMGIVYGTSSAVLYAEYKFGAVIGAMLAAILMLV